jgi:hypothetical protein
MPGFEITVGFNRKVNFPVDSALIEKHDFGKSWFFINKETE